MNQSDPNVYDTERQQHLDNRGKFKQTNSFYLNKIYMNLEDDTLSINVSPTSDPCKTCIYKIYTRL